MSILEKLGLTLPRLRQEVKRIESESEKFAEAAGDGSVMKALEKEKAAAFHGTTAKDLTSIDPRPSNVLGGEKAVFAAPDRDDALAFARPWTDNDFESGSVNNQRYMQEKYPGAIEKLLKGPANIYTLGDKGFKRDPRLMRSERISKKPEAVLKMEAIANVLAELEKSKYRLFRHGEQTPWPATEKTALTKAELKAHGAIVDKNPSEAQKENGNYRHAHISWQGLPIAIENPMNSYRRGVSKSGKAWQSKMTGAHYGYLKRTRSAADGDAVDIFLAGDAAADLESDIVFCVNQNKPGTDEFDEHKFVAARTSAEEAKETYLANYDKNWTGFGSIVGLTLPQFKWWLKNGDSSRPMKAEDFLPAEKAASVITVSGNQVSLEECFEPIGPEFNKEALDNVGDIQGTATSYLQQLLQPWLTQQGMQMGTFSSGENQVDVDRRRQMFAGQQEAARVASEPAAASGTSSSVGARGRVYNENDDSLALGEMTANGAPAVKVSGARSEEPGLPKLPSVGSPEAVKTAGLGPEEIVGALEEWVGLESLS